MSEIVPANELTLLQRARRFARLIVADQGGGDELVRSYLRTTNIPNLTDPANDEIIKSVFAGLRDVDAIREFGYIRVSRSDREERALEELETLSELERDMFALTRVEQFTVGEASELLNFGGDAADEIDGDVEREAFSFKRRVLIVDGNEDRASHYEDALRDLSIAYVVAKNFHEALLRRGTFDLLIIDPELDRIDELVDVLNSNDEPVPVIDGTKYLSGWRWGEIDGGREEETVQFQSGDFIERVRSILYIEPHLWADPDGTFEFVAPDQDVSDEALAPTTAPIDAEVVDGQLRPVPGAHPNSAVSFAALDALRAQLLENARFQADEVRGSNTAPRVKRHVEAIVPMLDQPLTDGMVLGLAVSIDGLARLLPVIEEELTRLAATDIADFILDLQRFTNQFPVFRQFNAEASTTRPVQPDEEAALQSLVDVVIEQSDAVVADELKQQFAILRDARAKQAGSAISDVAWMRSVANLLKAVARDVKAFSRDTGKVVRDGAVKGMGALVMALPVAGALHLLGAQYPTEFAALTLLLTRSREQIDKTLGKNEGDEK